MCLPSRNSLIWLIVSIRELDVLAVKWKCHHYGAHDHHEERCRDMVFRPATGWHEHREIRLCCACVDNYEKPSQHGEYLKYILYHGIVGEVSLNDEIEKNINKWGKKKTRSKKRGKAAHVRSLPLLKYSVMSGAHGMGEILGGGSS